MGEDFVAALESASRLHRAPRWRKLLAIPGKLAWSNWVRRSGRTVKTRVRTFWGEEITVVLPENVSLSIYRYGVQEYDLSRAFLEYLKPGMTFFDVGAHFGYFTCLASRLVGPGGQVHAFEPTPSTFEILAENAATRPNVRANNLAVFSKATTLRLNDFGVEFSAFNSICSEARMSQEQRELVGPARACDVQAVRLDDYVARSGARPQAIKIDAESAELEILRGAEEVLKEIRPAISLEVGDYAVPGVASSSMIVQHLTERGYVPHEWREGALRRHEARSSYAYGNLLFLPEKS
jgi:FkbM family methyltransferase